MWDSLCGGIMLKLNLLEDMYDGNVINLVLYENDGIKKKLFRESDRLFFLFFDGLYSEYNV